MSWSSPQSEMESLVPANDKSLMNTALASRRRHIAGLLREQLKNKARFRPLAVTRGRSDFSILDHYRTQGSTPSPTLQSSRVATKSPPPIYRGNLRTADLTRSPSGTETRQAAITTPQSNSSPVSSRSHMDRSTSYTSLMSSERQRVKYSNDETPEQKKKSFRERSPSIHEQRGYYEKVESREERQFKKSPTSVMQQQESRHCSSPATVQINTPPAAQKEIHLPLEKNYDGTHSLGGNVSMTNNAKSSISPMVINVPTINTPDDNDTVLTTSTSDQHEDLVRDLSNKFASVGGKEKCAASSPPSVSNCNLPSGAVSQQQVPISVRGRARLYDVQRKVTHLDSGDANNLKKLIHQKQHQSTVAEEEVQNGTSSNSDVAKTVPKTKKQIAVPTYFTPTRCWEVAPKPHPFKPMIQGKCGPATETSSASCGDDNATRTSSSNSSSIIGKNEFKERCRERQLEYLKLSTASSSTSQYRLKDDITVSEPDASAVATLPPPPPPTSPPPLLPTEYYAALSSALKINESLRRRIAYLETELALTRKIESWNDAESGLLKNKETQRSHTLKNW